MKKKPIFDLEFKNYTLLLQSMSSKISFAIDPVSPTFLLPKINSICVAFATPQPPNVVLFLKKWLNAFVCRRLSSLVDAHFLTLSWSRSFVEGRPIHLRRTPSQTITNVEFRRKKKKKRELIVVFVGLQFSKYSALPYLSPKLVTKEKTRYHVKSTPRHGKRVWKLNKNKVQYIL